MWDYGVKCETGHGNKFFTWTTPDMKYEISLKNEEMHKLN